MPSLPYQFPAPRSMPTRQVYDFPSVIAYTNYSQCVSRQPGRAYSQPFEVWKNRAFFPYTESIADATKGECVGPSGITPMLLSEPRADVRAIQLGHLARTAVRTYMHTLSPATAPAFCRIQTN